MTLESLDSWDFEVLSTQKFWSTNYYHDWLGGDSALATHLDTMYNYHAAPCLLLSLPLWVETLWCAHKNKINKGLKSLVSLHSRLMWSPTIRNISGITQKEPLGLLHRADHHTFPKCRILLKNILSFFFLWMSFKCQSINGRAHLLLFFFFFVLHLRKLGCNIQFALWISPLESQLLLIGHIQRFYEDVLRESQRHK